MNETVHNRVLPALLAACVAAVVGVVVSLADVGDAGSEYEARIATLEAEAAVLQSRVVELEKRRGRRGPRRGMTARDTPRRDRGDGADGSGWTGADNRPGASPSIDIAAALQSGDPEVREKMSKLVREEMEAAGEERWEERRRRRAERIEKALTEFAGAQGLTAADQDSLSDLWDGERERISETFRKAREDMSWGKAREEAERIREETDASAKSLLSAEDYTAWVQLREEENPRRR